MIPTLPVNANTLVFDKNERDPDGELRFQFEAMRGFSDEEKHMIKTLCSRI